MMTQLSFLYIVAEKPWKASFNKLYVCMYVLCMSRDIDVIIPHDVYRKIDVQTCYLPSKSHFHCSNILEVTEEGGGRIRTPGLNRVKNIKITKIRGRKSEGIEQLHPSPPLAGCFSIRINVITSQARKRNRLLTVKKKNPEKSLSWEAQYPSAIVIEPGNRR